MKTYTIEFNEQQLQVLNALLIEAPYRVAAPVVNHINAQIQKAHDMAIDNRSIPSGAIPRPDEMRGD